MNKITSAKLYEEAKEFFPGGVHSPVRAFKHVEGPPLFIKEGRGAYIYDEDDNKYLDFCCSWGPLILGHCREEVIEAIHKTLRSGTSFGTPTKLGNKIGRLICEQHEYLDKIRFVSSGTEAVMSAIRLARAYTGKQKIIKFEGCYHGHVDSLMVKAGSGLATLGTSTSAGIPESVIKDTIVLPLDDEEAVKTALKKYDSEIAATIIEPIPANNGLLLQRKEYLQFLRKISKEHQILLIFDEVISGFRVGFQGAAGHYGIAPDILTFGKIIGGGMPVGAYASNSEIMSMVTPEGKMYQAGTLSANPVAITAGLETLRLLRDQNLYVGLSKHTKHFANTINTTLREKGVPYHVEHKASIFWISFSEKSIRRADQIGEKAEKLFREFHAQLLDDGIYLGPSAYEVGFVSTAHTREDLDRAAEIIAKRLIEVYKNNEEVVPK